MAAVSLRRVWKAFGDQLVFERLDLHVHTAEFVTVVGPPRIGKTTLLHLVEGVERPTRGTVLFDDQPAPAVVGPQRGVVLQRPRISNHLDVLSNVAHSAISPGWRGLLGRWSKNLRKAVQAKAEAKLETVGLGDYARRMPQELDPEQEQRLFLAQSLISEPQVLLLDEPFAKVPQQLRQGLYGLLLDLWWRERMTIFMVTRELKEGFYLGTRLLVLDKRRHDPQAPNAYGATVTYDIPVGHTDPRLLQEIEEKRQATAA